ncbi:DUF4345 domain-containing protein [Vibrio alginolyticus]|uniref:DUF4345 domain-containing protein n=1 Tax=Vibrio alginolyticus TaxID=663 RepID=UPI0021608863|nr:DUF4345 domain-containing protein [Vibrio alginolyticus]MCS0172344.1 DUF4345 domain-containing protein [Vibrio alginolyticus]
MIVSMFERIVLGIAGVTAFTIGGFIALEPHTFYLSYGITLADDPNLLSELRGPGTNLAVLGAVMLAGLFYHPLSKTSIIAAKIVFFAFPVGRVIGILTDGMPSEAVLAALAVEIAIAALLFVAFRKTKAFT